MISAASLRNVRDSTKFKRVLARIYHVMSWFNFGGVECYSLYLIHEPFLSIWILLVLL